MIFRQLDLEIRAISAVIHGNGTFIHMVIEYEFIYGSYTWTS